MRKIAWVLLSVSLAFGQQWKTGVDLPNVEWKTATPAQKQKALKTMREFSCTCGCSMNVAQCRVEDPPCAQSKALSALAISGAIAGKTDAEIAKALASSDLAKRAAQRDKIMLDPVNIPIVNAPFKGPANAKITLVEFSDFQCPYCAQAVGFLNEILKAYPNDVRLVFKQYPLEMHSNARISSAAALAAHAQGKFWLMHDKMYANYKQLTRANILQWAKESGVDMTRFTADLDSQWIKQLVDKDYADGEKVGVEATPTVFINGKKYQGSLEPAAFKKIIAAELKGK
jgi:protein-disulfide isomerase